MTSDLGIYTVEELLAYHWDLYKEKHNVRPRQYVFISKEKLLKDICFLERK